MPRSLPTAQRAVGKGRPASSPTGFSRLNSLHPQPRPPPLSPLPPPPHGSPRLWLPLPPNRLKTRGRGPGPPTPPPGSGPSPPPPPRGATYPRGGSGGRERRSGVGEGASVRGGSQPRGAGAGASGSGGAASPPGGGSGGGGAVPLPQAHIGSIVRRHLPLSGSPLPVPPLPPPLGPPPAAPRHERYRRPRLGRERRGAPSPGPGVPPGGGMGTAPPRAGPAAGKGPPPSKGMSFVPLPERAQWYQPGCFLLPLPGLPGEAPPPSPRPPSSLASLTPPLPRTFYYGTAHRQHHLLLCMDTPTRSPPQFVTRPEVTPTPHLKAAEPSFSTKKTAQRAGGVGGAAREGLLFSAPSLRRAHSPGPPHRQPQHWGATLGGQ
ncbi:WAS/WASL-interacting protein family member 1-like [Eumetopias jubatus]|uniref:WAS/WASL-interacting protein family member 1-like n=1 Tax=Eumetopias jubatus TaxID=34886 RepID=UPI001016BFFE|nr:WAS/WASL-interacting protein family member 1-like [Eumetopias jubatus]